MRSDIVTASLNLFSDGIDCSLRASDEVAQSLKDGLDCAHDLATIKSPSDLMIVWSKYAARLTNRAVKQVEVVRDISGKVWMDLAAFTLVSASSPVSTSGRKDPVSPEEEVLLLHVME